MEHEVIFIDEQNNQYHFRVDGHSVHIYAECYNSAIRKLKLIYGDNIIIKES